MWRLTMQKEEEAEMNVVNRLMAQVHDADGQALAEYSLILGMILVAVVGGLALFGGAVVTPFTTFVEAAGLGSS